MSELLLCPQKVTVHTLLINKAACNQNEVLRDFQTEQRFWRTLNKLTENTFSSLQYD